MGYIVDSNVLIDYVTERFSPAQLKMLDAIFDEALLFSVITKIEVLGFRGDVPNEERRMIEFINYGNIMALNDDVVDKTIELKKSIKIKTPDAIIASTALVYGHTLITNNVADFKRIPGLSIFNPYTIQ